MHFIIIRKFWLHIPLKRLGHWWPKNCLLNCWCYWNGIKTGLHYFRSIKTSHLLSCIFWKFTVLKGLSITLLCSPAFPTLKLNTKHSMLALNELWKNHDGGIYLNLNAFLKTAIIELASDRDLKFSSCQNFRLF